jgi:NitT/TauT family transport system substrate-binding protein
MLQALARRSGLDLRNDAQVVYGAPPLLAQKALQGEFDATLTFWNFCAELEGKGMRRAVVMDEVMKGLGARGPVAIVGYVFDEGWAARNRAALGRFLDVTRKAKDILAGSAAEWQLLAPRVGVHDAKGLEIYRQRYLEGIPHRPVADEAADAQALYKVLAEIGGADLVGPARELDPGTFYRAGPGE